MSLRFAWPLVTALLLASGCASPGQAPPGADGGARDLSASLPSDATSGCSADNECPQNYRCNPNSRRCVLCYEDKHCPQGQVCALASNTCVKGCSANQGCGDAGVCQNGACVECTSDAECRNPSFPRCDVAQLRCFPCLPDKDNCAKKQYCQKSNQDYSCAPGCKTDSDCAPEVPDGGAPDGGPPKIPAKCDNNKCVQCKLDQDCPQGAVCKNGTCAAGCNQNQPCPQGLTCCADTCVDVATDYQNCGVCGKACNNGWNCCGAACSNPQNDVMNCNGCGNTCAAQNGIPACVLRVCTIAMCNPGWADCNGKAMDGCETNTDSNINNCGGCNNPCALANASPKCTGGKCQIAGCNFGYGDCDMTAMNGCETNTTNDPMNCGGCGTACNLPNAKARCSLGQCQIGACDPGFADCNRDPADGCEANITADIKNCGGCGMLCPSQNGAAKCVASTCQITCNGGFGNCDNNLVNGCEANTTNDKNNCGACGMTCPNTANVAQTSCTAGKCAIAGCNAGFFDLLNGYGDGCECRADAVGTVCNTPTGLGVLAVGGSVAATGNLVPLGNENWYQVTYSGNTDKRYHPRVRLTTNPGNAFRFDVRSNCAGGTQACAQEGGVADNRTDWEVWYAAGDPASQFNPIPQVGNNGTVYVRVYRVAGGVTCDNFILTVSN